MNDRDYRELDKIINSSPAVIFLWKAENGWPVEFVSDNILQFGYEADEFISGKLKFADIIHPHDLGKVVKLFSKLNMSDYPGFTIDYRIITKSGDIKWVNERTLIRRDDDGNLINYEGIIFDITDRKKSEHEMKLNQELMESLLKMNQMTGTTLQEITDFAREEAVRLTDSKLGYLAFTNADESVLTMHSWSKNAMKECKIEDKKFVYPLKTTGLWGESVRQRKPVITNDYSEPDTLKKGYPEGHVELKNHVTVPIFDGDRIVGVVGAGNKLSDYDDFDSLKLTLLMQNMWKLIQRKHLLEALNKYSRDLSKANAELKSLTKIKKEFIEGQRLKQSQGDYNKLLQDDMLESIEEQHKNSIAKSLMFSEKLNRLIDSLMFLSTEQAGKLDYHFGPVNIEKIVNNSLMNLILIIDENNLEIENEVSANLPSVRADSEKLTNVLINLLENAAKYNESGGKIIINTWKEDNYVHLSIRDTGKGIPEKIIPHLFQSIYQVNDSITRRYEGIESGLYLCKKVIDTHGGKIWIESEQGEGTIVHVKLPVYENISQD